MRIIFLFFLLVNVVYFYSHSDWFNDTSDTVMIKQEVLPEGVERLTLLRERGLGKSPVSVVNEAERPVVQKQSEKPSQGSQPLPVTEKAPSGASLTENTATKELGVGPVELARKPEKSSKLACFTLGPFNKATTADQAMEEISALGVSVKQRQVSQRKPIGYWVYLPSFKTYDAALKRVKALQKKGMKDMFIMGKGEHKNAVSLGLFKSKSAAEERFRLIKSMGLSVLMDTQFRVKTLAWLDLVVAGDQTSTVAALTEMEEEYSSTNLTQRRCE